MWKAIVSLEDGDRHTLSKRDSRGQAERARPEYPKARLRAGPEDPKVRLRARPDYPTLLLRARPNDCLLRLRRRLPS